jgi:hypothetical protein
MGKGKNPAPSKKRDSLLVAKKEEGPLTSRVAVDKDVQAEYDLEVAEGIIAGSKSVVSKADIDASHSLGGSSYDLLFGQIKVDKDAADQVLFDIKSVGAGLIFSLAIFHGVKEAINNEKLIGNLPNHLKNLYNKCDAVDLYNFRKAKVGKGNEIGDVEASDVRGFCKKSLCNEITTRTIKAGFFSSLTIAGCLLTIGNFFPPAIFVVFPLAIAVAALGTLVTLGASYINRRRMANAIDAISDDELDELARKKARNINKDRADALDPEKQRQKLTDEVLVKSENTLFATVNLAKASSLAEYSASIISSIVGGIISAVSFLEGLLSITNHYRGLNKQYDDMPKTVRNSISPDINSRKYLFFGATKLEQYIEQNKQQICQDNNLDEDNSARKIISLLKETEALNKLKSLCIKEELIKDVKKFCDKSGTDDSDKGEMIKKYMQHKVGESAAKSTFAAGAGVSFKLGMSIFAIGTFICPPLSWLFAAIGIGGAVLIGLPVTIYTAYKKNKSKFANKVKKLLEYNEDDLGNEETEESQKIRLQAKEMQECSKRIKIYLEKDDPLSEINSAMPPLAKDLEKDKERRYPILKKPPHSLQGVNLNPLKEISLVQAAQSRPVGRGSANKTDNREPGIKL